MAAYGWLKKTEAVSSLQSRLNSTTFWSADECWTYLSEALHHWSGLIECWNSDFVIPDASGAWINSGTLSGSPRLRTITDANLYTQMQLMLLEPPTGAGVWTGTNQFNLAQLQYALQKRTEEVIQASACNVIQLPPIPTTPGTRRNPFPDTVLEPRRIRYMALFADTTGNAASGDTLVTLASVAGVTLGQVVQAAGVPPETFVYAIIGSQVKLSNPLTAALVSAQVQFFQPVTLTREDDQAFQYFEPGYLQTDAIPQSWAISSDPPLAFDVDAAPNTPGTYDALVLSSGPTFAPPAATLLGVPDDWAWLPMYGALANLLGRESEATDRQRAEYCLMRYANGLEMIKQSNWLVQANINGVPVDTPSLAEMDDYAPEWQASSNNLPAIVQAGIDLVAPTPATGQAVSLTLVGSAPLLDPSGVYVQCARDDFEAILNYSQHVACFKQGSSEFTTTMPMLKDFYTAAAARNKRLLSLGIFNDVLLTEGQRQEEVEAR